MTRVNSVASLGASLRHIGWVCGYPCSNNSGGPLPPVTRLISPPDVVIRRCSKPGKKSATGSVLKPAGSFALKLDGVAVGVGNIKGRAVAFGAITLADLAGIDAVPLQMRLERRRIEADDPHREVIHVAPGFVWRLLRRDRRRDQIDQRSAGTQLDQLWLFKPTLDVHAQHILVEGDRAIEVADPEHHMVELADAPAFSTVTESGIAASLPARSITRSMPHFSTSRQVDRSSFVERTPGI